MGGVRRGSEISRNASASLHGYRTSRRSVLGAGLASAAALLLDGCGSTAKKAASVAPAGSDIGAIDHVVLVMFENRSFDHFFGSYRGVRGFDDHPAGDLGVFSQIWPGGTSPDGRLLPFHLDTSVTSGPGAKAECTHDLSHAWTVQHQCWNNGKMDQWVATHTNPANEGQTYGELTMGYYTRADLPFSYALADAFTICDRYHCSVLGPTHPNRLFAVSGTNDPAGEAGGPVLTTNISPSAMFSAHWPSMPDRLEAAGISWKCYNPPGSQYQPGSNLAMALSNNALLYFKQLSDPSSSMYQKAFLAQYPNDFAQDVANGTLPQVSWVVPGIGQDEHPPAPPLVGEWYLHGLLTTLVSNPAVWSKTVVFVTYDENDGFFDHVPPPTPPSGTPGEYVTVNPLPKEAGGIAGPIGLGVRVPMLVLSPFSRGGYVCSDVFDHTSQLRFIETRFGVQVPNLSAWRRSVTGDLTSTLGAKADTSVPALPATPNPNPIVSAECTSSQLIEIDANTGAYPIQFPQQMPVQEPGSARRL